MIDISVILGKLGFDWQVALANLINFLLVFFVLKQFVFAPIQNILQERKKKIEEGIHKANEAELHLHEVDVLSAKKLAEANKQALIILQATEEKKKQAEADLLLTIEAEQLALQKKMKAEEEKLVLLAKEKVRQEAVSLVKAFIVKTVEVKPEAIDEALIKKAVKQFE